MVTGVTLGVMLTRQTTNQSNDARTLATVFNHVSNNYVDDVSREKLMDDALRGMVDGLDPHSKYLDATYFEALQTDTTGRFGGIGVAVGLIDGYFTVTEVMPGTPAARAELSAGDRISRVDGESLRGKRLRDVIARLRGAPETTVDITVVRDGEVSRKTLARAEIRMQSVKHRAIEPGIAYFRVSQFHKDTHADLLAAFEEAGDDLHGIVLDLRDNPGGLLGASVDVTDEFLSGGTVVSIQGREDGDQQSFAATLNATHPDTPIAVLINGGSASAAEIVAGALRDHERATLIGSTTYGKGSVQSVLSLPGKRGVKLTTAHYFTPHGHAIHEKGVAPHIAMEVHDDEALIAAAVDALR